MGFYPSREKVQGAIADIPAVMRQVYLWMTVGLLVTAGTAFMLGQTSLPLTLAYDPTIMLVAIIAEFVLVVIISSQINRLSPSMALTLFLVYAVLNGVTLSMIFWVYELGTIAYAAIAAGAMFGAMSVIGYTTRIDLSQFRGLFLMALIGLIVASIINIFVPSNTLFMLINYAGVLIFVGLTAFDTQRIKRMALSPAFNMDDSTGVMTGRLAVIGALSLYLDMINLFLFLLRIMGGGRGGRR